jgi:sterol desaturase/sphingolipid hydroxylase (fatty acid hydroxylase superfamily)
MIFATKFNEITESLAVLKIIQPYAVSVIFILIYLVEHIIPQRKDLNDYNHDMINIAIGLGNLIIAGIGGYFLQKCLSFASVHSFGLLYFLPLWLQLFLGFILADLFMYWWHRANHIIPFLWHFHRFHHLDTKLNASSAVRFHTVELILSYFLKIPVFLLLGISSGTIIIYGIIFIPLVIFHHSNIRISEKTDWLLRLFIVSPRMHRIHHSVICEETNSNYSSVFPYWDKIFRSYRRLPEKEVVFGIS